MNDIVKTIQNLSVTPEPEFSADEDESCMCKGGSLYCCNGCGKHGDELFFQQYTHHDVCDECFNLMTEYENSIIIREKVETKEVGTQTNE